MVSLKSKQIKVKLYINNKGTMLSNIHFFPIFPVIIVSILSMNSPEKSILHV